MTYHTPLDQTRIPFDNKTLDYDIKKYPLPHVVTKICSDSENFRYTAQKSSR
jgi:hypothetical protein